MGLNLLAESGVDGSGHFGMDMVMTDINKSSVK
jgi:hypothetical protein